MEDKRDRVARRIYVASYIFGALFGIVGMFVLIAAFMTVVYLLIHFPGPTTIIGLVLLGALFGITMITPKLKKELRKDGI